MKANKVLLSDGVTAELDDDNEIYIKMHGGVDELFLNKQDLLDMLELFDGEEQEGK